jgi:hypothetical protein
VLIVPNIEYSNVGEPPNYEYGRGVKLQDDDVHNTQLIMQHYATQVMSYIRKLGPNVQVFSISPHRSNASIRGAAEENGHNWLGYFYFRSKVTLAWRRGQLVAIPARIQFSLPANPIFTIYFYLGQGRYGSEWLL